MNTNLPAAVPRVVLEPPKDWGLSDEALAEAPLAYRKDLLEGQVFVISGGGSGMGRAMAFVLARLGAQVVICGRRIEKLTATADAIQRLVGKTVDTHAMTIRDPEQVEAMMDAIWAKHGRLDCLVNNGGGQYPQAALDFTVKGWNAVIDTNLNGTWYMMQAAGRRWRAMAPPVTEPPVPPRGSIVNIVATIHRGNPQVAHTCAARAGVIYLSKTVATEWAPWNIRVNCIGPGVIETEGFRMYPEEALARFHNANPMKTRGNAWDVAEAIAYLASPAARFINGDLMIIDGGQAQWGVVWPAGMPDYFSDDGAA